MRNRPLATLMAATMLATAACGMAQAKDWKSVTIGVEGAFPPFNATKPNGELEGFDLDVAHEVCKRAKIECKIVAQDWDSQIPSLVAGKFDAVLTMGPNPKRRKVIDFTTPYAITPNTFLVSATGRYAKLPHQGERLSVDDAKGKAAVEDLKTALKGASLGAALSTSQLQFVQENFGSAVDLHTYKSSEQAQLDITSDRIDAQFDNVVFVTSMVEKSKGALKAAGPLLSGGIMATNVCFGIRKNEPELKAILDKGIASAEADGTLEKLSEKWFKTDVSPKS